MVNKNIIMWWSMVYIIVVRKIRFDSFILIYLYKIEGERGGVSENGLYAVIGVTKNAHTPTRNCMQKIRP